MSSLDLVVGPTAGAGRPRSMRLVTCTVALILALMCATAAAASAAPSVTGSITGSVSSTGITSNASLVGSDAVAVSGHYAFSPAYWSGQLNVFDVSNPTANPTLVASTPAAASMMGATNITISGNFAFVTAKNENGPCNPGPIPSCAAGANDGAGTGNSLTVINISNPLAPAIVGTVHDANQLFGAYSVAVSGNYAYVASQGLLNGEPTTPSTSAGSFSVIDLTTLAIVANVDNSSLSGTLANALDHATSVAISGNTAFVTAYYGDRLTAIDISNPTAVSASSVLGSIHDSTDLATDNDVAVSGNFAYIVNQVSSGPMFTVVNISTPSAMTLAGTPLSDPSLSGAYRVRVRGSFAYVAANNAGEITAVNIATPASPTIAGSVSDPNLRSATGIAIDPNGQYLVAASPRTSATSVSPYPPFPLQPGGPAVTSALAIIGITTTITPSSKPASPTTSKSATFLFTSNDPAATFTCSLDGAAATACSGTGASYSSLSAGSHTFTERAADSIGLSAQASYTFVVQNGPSGPTGQKPQSTGSPTITGTAKAGSTLKVSTGSWTGSPTFKYQWQRCTSQGSNCTAIPNATASSYRASVTDIGSKLRAVVTATNGVGTSTASATTGVVGWSSASFSSASLSFSSGAVTGAKLTISSPGSGLKLTKVVISLPKGTSFRHSKALLAAGIKVKSLGGKKVKFKLSLSHGKVTLTFKTAQTGVKISVGRRLVLVSSSLARKVTTHKIKTANGSLTLTYQGKPVRKGTVTFRV